MLKIYACLAGDWVCLTRSVKTRNLLVFGGKKTLPFIHLENVLLISLIAFMD